MLVIENFIKIYKNKLKKSVDEVSLPNVRYCVMQSWSAPPVDISLFIIEYYLLKITPAPYLLNEL